MFLRFNKPRLIYHSNCAFVILCWFCMVARSRQKTRSKLLHRRGRKYVRVAPVPRAVIKVALRFKTLLIVWCNMDDGEFKILNYFLKASHSCSWVNKRSGTGHSGNKFIALVDEKLLSNCREKRKREASSSAL
jgi:hypothetical protein